MRVIAYNNQLIMSRSIQVLLITLFVTIALSDQFDPNFSYSDFMRNYNRTYEGAERAAHEAAFNKNYAELLRLKSQGKDVVVNERLDWTQQQLSAFLNYNPQNLGIAPSVRPPRAGLSVSPTAFDWRTYGVVTPIKNQGSCGSCWAFAAIAEYESLLAMATNGTMYDLAEQFPLKCETSYSLGCSGGYPYRALQLLNSTGVPLQSAYPYNPSGSAGDICSNTAGRVKLNLTVNAVNFYYFQNLTVEQLQQDLVTYGPLNVGVYASDSNFMYAGSSGVISCGSSSRIDHAILLVGYTTTHWIVKNSWGTSWGNSGFGFISKSTSNDCNIRQYVNEMQVNFTIPPDPNSFNLTITMTDSFGDGWNGNVISVKQNNAVIGTFGGNFTNGSSSGPLYILVQGGFEVQIVVSQLGSKPEEIGFVVKAPNGTTIHQRSSGTIFDTNQVLSTFCPSGGCPATLLLTITMTDSYGDGWEGTVLGVKQNNTVVGTFGAGFTSGTASGPFLLWVQANTQVQIFVSQFGSWTAEVGFMIKAPNGTVIHQRNSGVPFSAGTIFSFFCPASDCPSTVYTTLTITMTDSAGDGWNSNILAVKQNNSVLVGTFGDLFLSGSSADPVSVIINSNFVTQIVVSQLGSKVNEVGFVIKASNGTTIYQKNSGDKFNASKIFTTFCLSGSCPDYSTLVLTITMTDSSGDGWEGNVLGIKQDGAMVGTFGSAFTSGGSSGPVSITVKGATQAQIVVSALGYYSSEVGFIVKAPNGTIIHQRISGVSFNAGTVFKIFCPVGDCPNSSYMNLTITLTDSFGDGWNSNVLAIKQNNSLLGVFGNTFTSGNSTDPAYIVVQANLATQIVVSQIGTKTNEIGFVVKASNGTVIYQRSNGTTFDSAKIFSIFCPTSGCSNMLSLTITLVDSYGDGWNSHVLAIKQNNSIIGTFGESFVTGSSSGPFFINVLGDLNAQVIVSQFGTKSDEVGFTVTAPNGTIVHQRTSGTVFNASSVFSTFCPIGGCPDLSSLILNITMIDSWGDGWNGNILAIKQNSTIVGTFGSTFTSGSSNGPVYITVQGSMEAQVVVSQLGSYTSETGFTVKAPNGTLIYQKSTGSTFTAGTIFATFCPTGGCPVTPNVTYYLTTTDSYGDGWEGTILAFKQNGTVLYTFTLANGSSNSSIAYSFPKLVSVSLTVYVLGNYTNQIGFQVKTSSGSNVFQWTAGTKFFVNTLLGSFCPECTNLSPASILEGQSQMRVRQPIHQQSESSEPSEPTETHIIDPTNKSYMIATYCLLSVVIILGAVASFSIYKLIQTQKEVEGYKLVGQASKQRIGIEKQIRQSHEVTNNEFTSSAEKHDEIAERA